MKSQPISKQAFEEKVREYFSQFVTPVTNAEIGMEWNRFQKGRSWFNEYLGEYHHE